jgi:hypothetical protein
MHLSAVYISVHFAAAIQLHLFHSAPVSSCVYVITVHFAAAIQLQSTTVFIKQKKKRRHQIKRVIPVLVNPCC